MKTRWRMMMKAMLQIGRTKACENCIQFDELHNWCIVNGCEKHKRDFCCDRFYPYKQEKRK